jgi:nucleoside-diphosphate kinase
MQIPLSLAQQYYAIHKGKTFGNEAETIRGDFGCSRGFNLIHGSDSPESASYEIGLYFKPKDIAKYDFADAAWLYGSNE